MNEIVEDIASEMHSPTRQDSSEEATSPIAAKRSKKVKDQDKEDQQDPHDGRVIFYLTVKEVPSDTTKMDINSLFSRYNSYIK